MRYQQLKFAFWQQAKTVSKTHKPRRYNHAQPRKWVVREWIHEWIVQVLALVSFCFFALEFALAKLQGVLDKYPIIANFVIENFISLCVCLAMLSGIGIVDIFANLAAKKQRLLLAYAANIILLLPVFLFRRGFDNADVRDFCLPHQKLETPSKPRTEPHLLSADGSPWVNGFLTEPNKTWTRFWFMPTDMDQLQIEDQYPNKYSCNKFFSQITWL